MTSSRISNSTSISTPISISIEEILARHRVPLLDAYGVLVDAAGALPGARELVTHLVGSGRPFFVITNDASRLPATIAARVQSFGLPIEAAQVISSGSLLSSYFARRGLVGARCAVLGPEDSLAYVHEAGGLIVPLHPGSPPPEIEVAVIADESGFPFLETVDLLLTAIARQAERGAPPHLVLPNPDLIYPARGGGIGIAAGSIARMLEAALDVRLPGRTELRFVPLGKPNRAIFEEAAARAGTRDLVMIGDQLETDIRGAKDFGIPSALLPTGVVRWSPSLSAEIQPDYVLRSLT